MTKTPAPNGAVLRQAGCLPAETLCGLAAVLPAQALVSPPDRKAAGTLCASGGQCSKQ